MDLAATWPPVSKGRDGYLIGRHGRRRIGRLDVSQIRRQFMGVFPTLWISVSSMSVLVLALAGSACQSWSPPSLIGKDESGEKVAVIDIQSIFERSESGKRALASLMEEFGELRRRLTDEEASLKQQAIRLERERQFITAEELGSRTERYLEQLDRYRVQVQRYNLELTNRHRALVADYIPKIVAVAKPLAEREGYSTVLHQGRPETMLIVFYHAPEIDLTERVIAALNRERSP
ncbi:hypothetical protein YTPLAS18_03820 [Nitrospira sp.]|nr:hypothetical protein YTPLAS18_03820 [Nitrospira sp.]